MPTVRLTTGAIKAFKYEGDGRQRDFRWDRSLPGFGLRLYPTGRKAFVVSYRTSGRKRLMVLGGFGAMTLDQARKRAKKALVAVADGLDPLEAREHEAQGKTVADLIDAYMERHAKVHKKTWAKDQRRFDIYLPKQWRGRKINGIARQDVARLHGEISRHAPYEANRFIEVLRKMFNLARIWGFLPDSAPNPAEGIQRNRERKRKRWLTHVELRAIVKAIELESSVHVRAAIWLYILTGVRRSELLSARRDNIDWPNGLLRLPDTKSGEEQIVVLSKPALEVMRAIPAIDRNPYLLPGAKAGRHMVNIDKPWRRIRSAAGIEDVRLHDIRRTVGSYMAQRNVDINLIKEVLRHQSIATSAVYARMGTNTVRDALEDHGRQVLSITGAPRLGANEPVSPDPATAVVAPMTSPGAT